MSPEKHTAMAAMVVSIMGQLGTRTPRQVTRRSRRIEAVPTQDRNTPAPCLRECASCPAAPRADGAASPALLGDDRHRECHHAAEDGPEDRTRERNFKSAVPIEGDGEDVELQCPKRSLFARDLVREKRGREAVEQGEQLEQAFLPRLGQIPRLLDFLLPGLEPPADFLGVRELFRENRKRRLQDDALKKPRLCPPARVDAELDLRSVLAERAQRFAKPRMKEQVSGQVTAAHAPDCGIAVIRPAFRLRPNQANGRMVRKPLDERFRDGRFVLVDQGYTHPGGLAFPPTSPPGRPGR